MDQAVNAWAIPAGMFVLSKQCEIAAEFNGKLP